MFVGDDDNDKLYAVFYDNGVNYNNISTTNPSGKIAADETGIYLFNEGSSRLSAFTFENYNLTSKWTFNSHTELGVVLDFHDTGAALDDNYVYINGITTDEEELYFIQLSKTNGSVTDYYVNSPSGGTFSYCNTPVIYKNRVYFTYSLNDDAKLKSTSTSFGNHLNIDSFNNEYLTPPVCYNDRAYIGDRDGFIYFIDVSAGNFSIVEGVNYDNGEFKKGLAISNNCLAAIDREKIYLINPLDGNDILFEDNLMNGTHYTAPVIKGNNIIFANQHKSQIQVEIHWNSKKFLYPDSQI